ncbi:isoprenoid synthase domain-containing protein [Mycena leptocephala]|nr:isoprenoid synthase domain-containing protein [Mycena leptocephala]
MTALVLEESYSTSSMSVQAREIRNKRRDPRRKRLHAPKTVQVRQDKVQVRRKPKSGEPSDRFTVRLMRLLIRILSFHHHLLPPCVHSRRFRTAMDEWQFSPPSWDSTSEAGSSEGFDYCELMHFSGIPMLFHLSAAIRKRIFDMKYLKTPEEVEAFKAWILTLADPDGWNTMEATTNLGEAQHAWNNAQTGISMGVIECFKNVAALQVELSEMKEELTAARRYAKADLSADATRHVCELEATVVDLEGKLKLAKAEAKSNSSGHVRAPKAGVGAATSNVIAPSTTAALPPSSSSELPISAPSVRDNLNVVGTRRVSAWKRAQADSSGRAPVPSNKRQKKLEDPLAGEFPALLSFVRNQEPTKLRIHAAKSGMRRACFTSRRTYSGPDELPQSYLPTTVGKKLLWPRVWHGSTLSILSAPQMKRFKADNFGRFASMAYTYFTDIHHFRVACELVHLLFVLDDMTDKMSVEEARFIAGISLKSLRNWKTPRPLGEHPVGEVHRSFSERFHLVASAEIMDRFLTNYDMYLKAVIDEANDRDHQTIRSSMDAYLTMRRDTGADILSINAEQAGGDIHNAAIVVMQDPEQTLSIQDTMDFVGAWYQIYVATIANWVTSNYEWSLRSGRYFAVGQDPAEIGWVVPFMERNKF